MTAEACPSAIEFSGLEDNGGVQNLPGELRRRRRERKNGFWGRLRRSFVGRDEFEDVRNRLAGIEGPGEFAKQRLPWPASGQVNAEAAGSLAHEGTELEQSCAQGFNLRRAPCRRQMQAK